MSNAKGFPFTYIYNDWQRYRNEFKITALTRFPLINLITFYCHNTALNENHDKICN